MAPWLKARSTDPEDLKWGAPNMKETLALLSDPLHLCLGIYATPPPQAQRRNTNANNLHIDLNNKSAII